jgi:hypothetical protein
MKIDPFMRRTLIVFALLYIFVVKATCVIDFNGEYRIETFIHFNYEVEF